MTEHFQTGMKKGRGRAQWSIDLIKAMHEIAEEAEPITGRGVGYKLFSLGLILDAMDPNDLRSRVEEEIERHIEPEAWERCRVVDAAERESLRHVLDCWRGGTP
jgi:hypothetical protein